MRNGGLRRFYATAGPGEIGYNITRSERRRTFQQEHQIKMRRLLLMSLGSLTFASHAQIAEKSDSQLRAAIERHVWYSARHGYRFLSTGVIAVDGYPTDQRWSIHGGLLYRERGNSDSDSTKIIEINDRQLVEQEISGAYKGSVEVMYSQRPRAN
jgi:hypothetical protein